MFTSTDRNSLNEKISHFLNGNLVLTRPFRPDLPLNVRIQKFICGFLSEIQSSPEIQAACTKVEAALAGTYLANLVIDLHPVVNDKDIKIHFVAKPGVNKDSLYMHVYNIALKHFHEHAIPKKYTNCYPALRDIGILKDAYSFVKGMGLGSISLECGWGEAPLELSLLVTDSTSLTHLTNVDSLYVPLKAFGSQLGSEAPGEFVLRSRESEDIDQVLQDLSSRVITSAKVDWDPAQVSHFELARYLIWIVERWTEPGTCVFSCFAQGSLSKKPPHILWHLLYNKVKEKRHMFSSYPFFLLSNFLFHFYKPSDPSPVQMFGNDLTQALNCEFPPFVCRSLKEVLYTKEKIEGSEVSTLKSNAFFLLSSHLPLLAQKAFRVRHLGRDCLQCCFSAHAKEFSVLVPIPQDVEEFRQWISEIITHGRLLWVLHILYLLEEDILRWILQSFSEDKELGAQAFSLIFSTIAHHKKSSWIANFLAQCTPEQLQDFAPQCLSFLSSVQIQGAIRILSQDSGDTFYQVFPYIQKSLPYSRQEILMQLLDRIHDPNFYKKYIELCPEISEKMDLAEFLLFHKNEQKDIEICKSSLSALSTEERAILLARILSKTDISQWDRYLEMLEGESEYLVLITQLFPLIPEEQFLAGLLQVQTHLPFSKHRNFKQAVLTCLVPKLPSTSSHFQEQCRNELGVSVLNWLSQILQTESEETFFQALSWSISTLSADKKMSFIHDLFLPLIPHLNTVSPSFWESFQQIVFPIVTNKRACRDLFHSLISELPIFPECLISSVKKCGLNFSYGNSSQPLSVQEWLFNLKLSLICQSVLEIKDDVKCIVSQQKQLAMKQHFSSANLLKPIFNNLLINGLWEEAFSFLQNLKIVFGPEEILSWYAELASVNGTLHSKLQNSCLKAVRQSWTQDKSWAYFDVVASFPLVVAYLEHRGFSDPTNLPADKKEAYLDRFCSRIVQLTNEAKVTDAIRLASYLSSLGAQERDVSTLLLNLFEKCSTQNDRVMVAEVMQKLAPSLTSKLMVRFKNPYKGALQEPLSLPSGFSIDLWALAFLQACSNEENPQKHQAVYSWIVNDQGLFSRKFPRDFPDLLQHYTQKMSIQTHESSDFAGTR